MSLRYTLDFFLLPDLIRERWPLFHARCQTEGAAHIAGIFNLFCRINGSSVHYDHDQFSLSWYELDDRHRLLYIDLPDEHTDGMCCTACIAVYDPSDEDTVPEVYHIEMGALGTHFIGQMGPNGHRNHGPASPIRGENIDRISHIIGLS